MSPPRSRDARDTRPEPSDWQPCMHCGKSFRPAGMERHVKVCQNIMQNDAKRHSRELRLKAQASDRAPEKMLSKASAELKAPKAAELPTEVPDSVPMIFGGPGGCEPGSPLWSLEGPAPEALTPSRQDVDQWEKEVEEAIHAMSEPGTSAPATTPTAPTAPPPPDINALTFVSTLPLPAGTFQEPPAGHTLEERATLLERARFGMKMGQRPRQALVGSMSEAVLRQSSEKCRSTFTPAARAAPAQAETASACGPSPPHPGRIDPLSRSQPVVPIAAEAAPLSSRSRRPEVAGVSPKRSGGGQPGPVSSGALRLPLQRREVDGRSAAAVSVTHLRGPPESRGPGASVKVKPGVAREDPAPAKIPSSQSFSLASGAGANSPLPSRSGSMQLPVRSHTPRDHWQASFAVPAAPPPSPVPGRCEVISSISSPRYTPRTGLLRTSSPVTLSPRSSVGAGYAVGVAARSVGVLGTGPRPGLVPRLDLGKVKRSS